MCRGGRSNLDVVLFGEISKKARRVNLITEAAPKNAVVSVRVEGLIFTKVFIGPGGFYLCHRMFGTERTSIF